MNAGAPSVARRGHARFTRAGARFARIRAFLAARKPELALVLLAVLLRASMTLTYGVGAGYDWSAHYQYIKWVFDHGDLPSIELGPASYHPPLFYWLASAMLRAGAELQTLGAISILAGCLRVVVIWIGFEIYLPGERFARLVGLALLAIFPTDIHLDGMVTNEGLSTLFCAAAALLLPIVLEAERPSRQRHAVAAALGVVLGLALLTKVSATVLLTSAAIAAALGLGRAVAAGTRAPRVLFARVAPLLTAVLVTTAIAGWFYARNQRLYGKVFVTGYDGIERVVVAEFLQKPFLDRRTIGYVAGFDTAIFTDPYYPTASLPSARFSSLIVATTFADYFNFEFGAAVPGEPTYVRLHRTIRQPSFALSRASVLGGVAIALAVVVAWLAVARHLWRRKDDARLVLLLILLLALLGQLTFAIRYPNDTFGPVKGVYLQFAAPPLYALFGLAVAWAWRRRRWRPVAGLCLAAHLAVAAYTLECRLPHIPMAIAARLARHAMAAPARPTPLRPPPRPAPPDARVAR